MKFVYSFTSCGYTRVGYARLINTFRRHARDGRIKNMPNIHGTRASWNISLLRLTLPSSRPPISACSSYHGQPHNFTHAFTLIYFYCLHLLTEKIVKWQNYKYNSLIIAITTYITTKLNMFTIRNANRMYQYFVDLFYYKFCCNKITEVLKTNYIWAML